VLVTVEDDPGATPERIPEGIDVRLVTVIQAGAEPGPMPEGDPAVPAARDLTM
jgi:hypothetical protein